MLKLFNRSLGVDINSADTITSKPISALISSRLTFIFVAAGAAIGLGNIWKFPYMVGVHGGSAFVLSYLAFVLIVGIPTMVAEILIGRAARSEPVSAFSKLASQSKGSRNWGSAGALGILTSLIALSFYSVVAGWAIGYAVFSILDGFQGATGVEMKKLWEHFLNQPSGLIFYHTLFLGATIMVNAYGVSQGIERMSKTILPMLFIVLIGLTIVAAKEGDFAQTLRFMFEFRIQELTSESLLSAMGHAFFTLAVGACAMLVYGSYMPQSSCIFRSVFVISAIDVIVALLAGLAIFPIVFKYGLTPEAGPGLMFQVLPVAFGQMSYGWLVGFFFFILLLFSAWTTSIAMVEPILAYMTTRFELKRVQAALIIGLIAWALGLLSVFSFSSLSGYKILGHWGIFEFITDLTSNILLPLGGLLVAIFVGWRLKKSISRKQLNCVSDRMFNIWWWALKTVTPIGIIIIMLNALLN